MNVDMLASMGTNNLNLAQSKDNSKLTKKLQAKPQMKVKAKTGIKLKNQPKLISITANSDSAKPEKNLVTYKLNNAEAQILESNETKNEPGVPRDLKTTKINKPFDELDKQMHSVSNATNFKYEESGKILDQSNVAVEGTQKSLSTESVIQG